MIQHYFVSIWRVFPLISHVTNIYDATSLQVKANNLSTWHLEFNISVWIIRLKKTNIIKIQQSIFNSVTVSQITYRKLILFYLNCNYRRSCRYKLRLLLRTNLYMLILYIILWYNINNINKLFLLFLEPITGNSFVLSCLLYPWQRSCSFKCNYKWLHYYRANWFFYCL
jgi:hypothetical protein